MVRIAVIGAGPMGLKIAGMLAFNGHQIHLYDIDKHLLSLALEELKNDAECFYIEGLSLSRRHNGSATCFGELKEAVEDVEYVFEAVTENLTIKQKLFMGISEVCRDSAILASNSLTLDINEVFAKSKSLERTIGVRFMYPVHYIPEVEITPCNITSPLAVEKVSNFLESMGKTVHYRKSCEPWILSDEEILERKNARIKEIKRMRMSQHSSVSSAGDPTCIIDNKDSEVQQNVCSMCQIRPRNCVLNPCHHMVTCMECAKKLKNHRSCCPVCCKEIVDLIRIYDSL